MRFWIIFQSFCVVFLVQRRDVAGDNNDNKGRLLQIATKTTATKTLYSVVTSQLYSTCVATNGLNLLTFCTGRRRRRSLGLKNQPNLDAVLEGSQIDTSDVSDVESDSSKIRFDNHKSKRLFGLTLWKTASVVSTITIASTNFATQVSLSLVCIAPGLQVPPMCG